MWKVYSLKDPRDGRIRYIGCTSRKTLRKRLNHHLGQARNPLDKEHGVRRNQWMRELLNEGLKPTIHLIYEFPTREAGWAAEKHFIEMLRPQLVNETGGGGGITKPSPELAARLSLSNSQAQKLAWAKDDGTRRAQIAAIGASRKGMPNPAAVLANTGRPLTKEHKDAIRAHHRTPEFRRYMSERKMGTKQTPESVEKRRVGIKTAWDRRKAKFLALPIEEQERINEEKAVQARAKKNTAQQRRRAAQRAREANT